MDRASEFQKNTLDYVVRSDRRIHLSKLEALSSDTAVLEDLQTTIEPPCDNCLYVVVREVAQ